RGYALVDGRDVSDARGGEVVVERGLADEFGLRVGDKLHIGQVTTRVVGIAVGPDNVAFPLALTARVYVPGGPLVRRFGPAPVNVAELWLRDPSKLDEVLTQARAVAYGLHDLRFITRGGVRATLDQAAGLIVALLVAFALVTLGAAALMLAASAQAEVQRRLRTIGVQRALGFSRGQVMLQHVVEAALVAAPAACAGVALGALAANGPVGERYFVDGADAFALGQPVRLIAYPGDHTRFESPPLASGRRVAAPNEAEVGLGLAQALGLEVGTTLAVDLQGGEARFRVVGID